MWIYLLKFSACLAILLMFYKLVLEQMHLHHFKRYYLLSAFIIALGIPLITFTQYVTVTLEPTLIPTYLDQTSSNPQYNDNNAANILPSILWSIYALGATLFSLKFFFNLRSLIKSIRNNPKLRSGRIHHVLLQELIAPHTFFSYIFFNRKKYEARKIPKEVFWHEETHANQKHSLDILFFELLQILFWFHPFVYWTKHLAKLNHEFLADQTVINKGAAPIHYQNMVLAFSSNAAAPSLANAIHYSSIKKRIVIMKTQTSKKAIWLKSLLLLPLLALLLYSFSSTQIVQEIIPSKQELPSVPKDSQSGATETMMQEYRAFTDNLQKSETQIIKFPEYQRIEAIYELMTDKQLASVTDYRDIVKIPNLNISKTKSIRPSVSLFESWKDSKKYAIWIDGKHVSNTILDQYNSSDIIHFTSSFVYNNARSEKFPQPYQNRLYTKNGFEEAYSKYSINEYNELSNQYGEEIKSFLKKNQLDTSELRILKVRLDQLYNSFSKDELEKYSVLAPAPVPIPNTGLHLKSEEDQNIPKEQISIAINKFGQLLVNADLVKIEDLKTYLLNYNQNLTKELRSQTVRALISVEKETPENIIKQVDAILMDYGVATINIEENTKYINQEGATKTEIREFNKLAKLYNAQPQEKRVVPLKDLKTLEGIYGRMTDSQKKEAQPFPECPPPPPPPIPSAPERSIEPSQAIPPPPPPYALPNEEKHSKVLLEAFKKFDKKANAYSKATEAFTKKGEGTLVNLQTLYEETMVLYNGYVELAIKEDLMKPTRTISTTKKEERKIEPKKANLKEIENNTSEQDEKVEEDNIPSPTLKSSAHQKIKTAKEPSVYYGHLYTVPQPPPQKNTDPVEYIKELAEKGATFYIGPHQYKTDEAIELVRKSKDPNIDVSDYPIVRLGGC